jgi:hypothetical protein
MESMHMDWRSKDPMNRKIAIVALGVSLIAQTITPGYALALFNNSSAPKKGASLQYEVYSKLSTGAGPATNDLKKQEPKLDTTVVKPVDLSPVKIDDENKPAATASGDTDATGMLKAKAERHNVMESGPVEQSAAMMSTSLKKSVGDKVLNRDSSLTKNAKQVNAMPVALQQTEEEAAQKDDEKFQAEKLELADLWDSTLARSQDIQFVVQKLMPTSNANKTTNVMMKMLSAVVFGGMGAGMMMAPNMGTQMGMNMGASMIMQGLNGVQGNQAKKAKISQEEAIMLYKMVRDTADKLCDRFRDYKRQTLKLRKTGESLEKLQNMVRDARSGQDAAKQIEMEYYISKAQGDVEDASEQVRHDRQNLVDLAGGDAVAKLDKDLEVEQQKLNEIAAPTKSDNSAIAGDAAVVTH